MGKTVCRVDFTVTQLLFGVDLVLGINWLALWNSVVDWKLQKMNIWTGREWNQTEGIILHSACNTGTIKDFDYCGAEKTDSIPDFIKMKKLQFWEYETGSKTEWKRTGETKCQSCIISKMSRLEEKSKSNHTVNVVQRKKTAGQRQITSAKQLHREPRRGNAVYLALVLPKAVQPQGMTQQQKREQMKLRGPVRKALSIAETKKKFFQKRERTCEKNCISYWRSSQIYFQNNSRRAGLQKGRSISKSKPRKGLFRRTNYLIASARRSKMSCKLRLMTYSLRDISILRRALMEP